MAFDSYASLQAEITDYLARSDLAAKIPTFIRLAEAKFNRSLRCIQMETRASTSTDINSSEPEFVTLPTGFQSMKRMRLPDVQGKTSLYYRTQVQLDDYRASIGNIAGQPKYFTVFGTELELCPTPDASYRIEMVYRHNIPSLSDQNTTNWLLALAPDAYLYGALLESAPYIKDDERIQVWAGGLTTVIDGLNSLSSDMQHGAQPLQITTGRATP